MNDQVKKAISYNIICFGFMPWSNMWKRNQSMMAEIAKCDFINRVIFVNPIISIRGMFSRKKKYHNKFFFTKFNSKIWIYSPLHILPYRYLKVFEIIETKIIVKIIKKLNSHMSYILFMNCPNIFSHHILDELLKGANLSIFDFSDDFVELVRKEDKEIYLSNITKYAKAADVVLTVNDHLKEKYGYLNTNIHVLRNATNYYNFNRKDYKRIDVLERIKDKKKPIIGYSGLANMSRIDADLLDYLFEKRKEWQFVFVGPAKSNFIERYSIRENYHYISPVNYELLPDYIRYFDVAIVPFKINEHTKGNDLLKFHDYLLMGKPVVSTDTGGANDLKDVIRISFSKYDFLEHIESALMNDTSEDILKRKSIAFKNSWHIRIKELEDLIKGHLKYN
jgi:hypothetical protein